MSSKATNFSREVALYLKQNPTVRSCIERGLVNLSAVSREIANKLGKPESFDALQAALRRQQARLVTRRVQRDDKLIGLIKKAKVRIRNRIAVAIIRLPASFETLLTIQREVRGSRGDFRYIEGEDSVVVITNDEYLIDLKRLFGDNVIRMVRNLALVSLLFDEDIETTSGIVASVYNFLWERGVNVREEMSCWTDLLLVIDEGDLSKAMEALHIESPNQ
jgi:hypothetical protein